MAKMVPKMVLRGAGRSLTDGQNGVRMATDGQNGVQTVPKTAAGFSAPLMLVEICGVSRAGVLAPHISMKICGVSRYGCQNGVKMAKMVPKMVLRGGGP